MEHDNTTPYAGNEDGPFASEQTPHEETGTPGFPEDNINDIDYPAQPSGQPAGGVGYDDAVYTNSSDDFSWSSGYELGSSEFYL